MAQLEAVLRISAADDTAKALAAIKEKIQGIEQTAGHMTKYLDAVGRVTKASDPFAASIDKTQKALAGQKAEIAGVVEALDRIIGPTDRAASAQRNLTRQVEVATGALARQGEVAARAARGGGSGGGHSGGGHGALGMLPFLGPAIEHGAAKYFEAGATVEQEIARLKAMGASPADIARARGDWRSMSKNYAGMKEGEYLAGYHSARTVAPDEAFEMAGLAAKYRLALRNSGLSASDTDVESVMKIMDERGLRSHAQRDDFINQMLKTQQTFGNQITPETYLAAVRNAGQSVYRWSPQFANSYLPTILQSMGERGGTQISTAMNNWVGGPHESPHLGGLIFA